MSNIIDFISIGDVVIIQNLLVDDNNKYINVKAYVHNIDDEYVTFMTFHRNVKYRDSRYFKLKNVKKENIIILNKSEPKVTKNYIKEIHTKTILYTKFNKTIFDKIYNFYCKALSRNMEDVEVTEKDIESYDYDNK